MLRSKEEYHRLDEERQTDPSRFQPHGPLGNIQTFQGDFICHIAILADFTTSGTIYESSDSTDILTSDTSAIEAAAGAFLGIHHWNTRNTSVIKELEDVDFDTCNLQFTSEVLDGQTQRTAAIQQVTSLVLRRDNVRPCTIFSAIENDVTTIETATLASAQNMIYVSPSTTVHELDNRQSYPTFVRMNASIRGSVRSALQYLLDKEGVQYFGLAYPETQEGLIVRNLLLDAAKSYNMSALLVPIPVSFASSSSSDFIEEETNKNLEVLINTQLNYTISYIPIQQYNAIRRTMSSTDTDESHFMQWILVEPDEIPSSPSDIRSARHLLFREEFYLSRPNDDEGEDIFQQIWKEDIELWNYTNTKLAPWTEKSTTNQGGSIPNDGKFARLSYDTIIGMGLSACRTMKENGPNDFWGIHHDELVNPNETFHGASGKIQFSADINSCREENSYYIMSNIHQDTKTEHIQSYYQPSTGKWYNYSTHEEIPNGSILRQSFHQDLNLISNATRVTCLSMCLFALLSSLGCLIYTVVKWKHPIIKSSQPPFLITICCGTILMSSSIIPMTMDNLYAVISCNLQIWLFFSGFVLLFSALFSKLWRVNRVSCSCL
jgi:hypothetical protein